MTGIEIAPISPAEQENYATNFLHLGNGFVVVPVENKEAIAHLEKYIPKEKIIKANIYALIGGYGAVHCMTAALRRE